MSKNKKATLLIVGILLTISVITGVSYGLWTTTRTQTDTNIVESGCFSMELVTGTAINLETEFPIADEEGLQTEPFHFTINNTCDTDASVEIKLLAMNETTMGLDHVKLALEGIVGIEPTLVDSLTDTTTTTSGVKSAKTLKTVRIAGGDTRKFDLRLWIDEDATKEEEASTKFIAKIEIDGSAAVNHLYADHSGANAPDLYNGLIPVVYQNNKWIKADLDNEWYDYDKQWWANAVTVKEANRSTYTDAEPGTEIPMSDINTMWVWVPRYSYTIKSEDGEHYYGSLDGNYTYCKDISSPSYKTYPECYEYILDESNKTAFKNYLITVDHYTEEDAILNMNQLFHDKYDSVADIYLKDYLDDAGVTYQEIFHGENIANYHALHPAMIDIKFISKKTKENGIAKYMGENTEQWYTHPAFRFGEEDLTGMWVAKFEMSPQEGTTCATASNKTNCDITTFAPEMKPNVKSWRNARVGTFFTAVQTQMNGSNGTTTYGITNSDVHLIKNLEWGAVAYLSQSKYGKYGNASYTGANREIYQNKSMEYITGSSNGTPSQSIRNTQVAYNVEEKGTGASTTGNIYGIYDMSGGAYEYVMGVMKESTNTEPMVDNSGFSGKLYNGTDYTGTYGYLKDINSKYYDVYNYINTNANGLGYENAILGDATRETMGWYYDGAFFVDKGEPWFLRGEVFHENKYAGIFAYNFSSGGASLNTSRPVLVSAAS